MKKNAKMIIAIALISTVFLGSCGNNKDVATQNTEVTSSSTTDGSFTNFSGATEKNDDNEEDTEFSSNVGTIALGDEIQVTGNGVNVDGSTVKITSGGDFTVSGILTDGMVLVDTTEKVKLRLNGVDITNSTGPAIYFKNTEKGFITLVEGTENILTDGANYADEETKATLFSNDSLEIKGNGLLTVNANYKHGVASDDDVNIVNGNITINAVKDGIHANNNIAIDGGNITVTSDSDALDSEGDLIVNGGNLSLYAGDDGIHSDVNLIVNSGTINIFESVEGIEGKNNIEVNGGIVNINSTDDAINSGVNLVINDGEIYADANGDGIDSNGDMTINGGYTVVFSGDNANGPLDIGDGDSSYIINGGTVIATGGNMNISISEDSRQNSLYVNSKVEQSSTVNIATDSGEALITFQMPKSCSSIYYSSPNLELNSNIVVSAGGISTGTNVNGVYKNGTYSDGTEIGTATVSTITTTIGQGFSGGGMRGPGGKNMKPEGTPPQRQ